jgi:hypothetical protein
VVVVYYALVGSEESAGVVMVQGSMQQGYMVGGPRSPSEESMRLGYNMRLMLGIEIVCGQIAGDYKLALRGEAG